ncbi:MAG: lytic transglycosylase domain-containing protein [Gammaproteobacteria bacterium]|nr:lytic transglycosylase domain-containing protein [Gammaproteobacteria bacterium]MBU1555352.1 lytic transglycosylase domain-containing protein [Gammaproteobacteria bacterium]MBU2069866.1 lytic transglycosylase domain-containing protein [Gammaproteobacteria bacterium]MBU2184852.1 lytic transglycosylase domain-containing protein [Gammaproteobacteria bacterium]MBU2204388.1 lytic transglycosylase domain-containing protein [Gammaproteobacteria bacterium]
MCCIGFACSSTAQEDSAETKKQLKLIPGQVLHQAAPAVKNKPSAQIAVYKSVKADGTAFFSDRQPLNRPYQLLRFDCFACDPVSNINWHTVPLYVKPYNRIIAKAATEHQLDPALIRAVIHAESSFRPQVISKKGAVGLMQLMPQTSATLGVQDANHPEQNINAGSRYLAQLLKQHNNELTLALAAYNAGPGNVKRYNGIPPFAETQAYVERVVILHKRYQQQS